MLIKPSICFIVCLLITSILAVIVGPAILVLLGDIIPTIQIIITVLAALSFVFFTYIDNIEQKFTDLYKKFQESKIDKAHVSIAELKKEILTNVFFVISIVILERIISAVPAKQYYLMISGFYIEGSMVTLIIRLSLFLLELLVFVDQGKAFITAVQFRHIVSKGAGKQ